MKAIWNNNDGFGTYQEIRRTSFADIKPIRKMYNESSKETKFLFDPSVLRSPVYRFFFILSSLRLSKVVKSLTLFNVDYKGDRKVIGFIYILKRKKNSLGMMIREGYRGNGHGTKLMDLILNDGEERTHLSVNVENEAAVKLYKNFGFKIKINNYVMFRK